MLNKIKKVVTSEKFKTFVGIVIGATITELFAAKERKENIREILDEYRAAEAEEQFKKDCEEVR